VHAATQLASTTVAKSLLRYSVTALQVLVVVGDDPRRDLSWLLIPCCHCCMRVGVATIKLFYHSFRSITYCDLLCRVASTHLTHVTYISQKVTGIYTLLRSKKKYNSHFLTMSQINKFKFDKTYKKY